MKDLIIHRKVPKVINKIDVNWIQQSLNNTFGLSLKMDGFKKNELAGKVKYIKIVRIKLNESNNTIRIKIKSDYVEDDKLAISTIRKLLTCEIRRFEAFKQMENMRNIVTDINFIINEKENL